MPIIHGYSDSSEHAAWRNMIYRCTNPKNRAYPYYGGRGIQVCERWRNSFLNFLEDLGFKPNILDTLGRINNDGNYEPGNVKWMSFLEQAQNRRPNNTKPRVIHCSLCGSPNHNSQTCCADERHD